MYVVSMTTMVRCIIHVIGASSISLLCTIVKIRNILVFSTNNKGVRIRGTQERTPNLMMHEL